MSVVKRVKDDSLGDYEIPDPDQDLEVEEKDAEYPESASATPSGSFLNAPPIYNMRFQDCVESIAAEAFETSKIIALVEAVSLVIPERHLTEFREWQELEGTYGPIVGKKLLLDKDEFLDRFRAVVRIAKEVGIAGRAAQQSEPARFLSFASLYPLEG